MIQYTIIMYSVYLLISLALAIWVAQVLFQNAQVFWKTIFRQDEALSSSVNQLLKIGFYLASFGFILFLLPHYHTIENYQALFEVASFKVGGIVLLLGIMHFLNVYVLFRLRKRALAYGEDFDEHPHFGKGFDGVATEG